MGEDDTKYKYESNLAIGEILPLLLIVSEEFWWKQRNQIQSWRL